MNIMSVDTAVAPAPDTQAGSTKEQTEGTDSFSILMAAIAAGNLIQQVKSDATVAKGAVPELMGTAAPVPPTPPLSGQITEVNPSIVGDKTKADGLIVTSQGEESQNLASLLNMGKATGHEPTVKKVLENLENPNFASLHSFGKATDLGQIGKNGLDATKEVSAREEVASVVPETPNPFTFLNKSLKGAEAGMEGGSHELKGPEFKLVQQDVKEIATVKADAASEGVQVFNQHPVEMVVTGATVDGKGSKVHSDFSADPADLVKQVSGGFKSVFKSGSGEVRMELHPESLGHLKIEVKVEGGVVRANIVAENSMVKDTIDSNLPMLRKSLEDQGLRIDQLSVGIDQRQGGSAFAERERFHMWQSFNGEGVQSRDEDQPLNEPLYRAVPLQTEGVSIFA